MASRASWIMGALALSLTCVLPTSPSRAQGVAQAGQGKCQAAPAEPATQPAPASADGTAPGNSGSTGWTGGLGGSAIGTSQNGPTAGSKSTQPATAQGVDPTAAPPKPDASGC